MDRGQVIQPRDATPILHYRMPEPERPWHTQPRLTCHVSASSGSSSGACSSALLILAILFPQPTYTAQGCSPPALLQMLVHLGHPLLYHTRLETVLLQFYWKASDVKRIHSRTIQGVMSRAASRLSTDCNSGFALLFVAGSVFLPFLYLEARTSAQEKLGLGLSWRHQAPTFPLPLPP